MTQKEKLMELLSSPEVLSYTIDSFTEHLADYLLDNGVTAMANWISVKDEMPPKNQRVLAVEKGKVKIVWFGRIWPSHPDMWHNDYGQTMVGAEVTHWMPLPEPPKEEVMI